MKIEWKGDNLKLDGYHVERRDYGKIIDQTPNGKALICWREDFIITLPDGAKVSRTVSVEDTLDSAINIRALMEERANEARKAFESMSKEITLRTAKEA